MGLDLIDDNNDKEYWHSVANVFQLTIVLDVVHRRETIWIRKVELTKEKKIDQFLMMRRRRTGTRRGT